MRRHVNGSCDRGGEVRPVCCLRPVSVNAFSRKARISCWKRKFFFSFCLRSYSGHSVSFSSPIVIGVKVLANERWSDQDTTGMDLNLSPSNSIRPRLPIGQLS